MVGLGTRAGFKVRAVGRRMRWIIDEPISTSEDPNATWWDWFKGLSLWDSVTGLVARSGGVG